MPDVTPVTKEQRIAQLAQADDDVLADAVETYLLGDKAPTPADHEVFRDDQLIRRTREAMTTLIAELRAQAMEHPQGSKERNELLADQAVVSAARKELGPLIGALIDRERKAEKYAPDNPSVQRRVGLELARRHPQEAAAIRREIREQDEAAEARTRRA